MSMISCPLGFVLYTMFTYALIHILAYLLMRRGWLSSGWCLALPGLMAMILFSRGAIPVALSSSNVNGSINTYSRRWRGMEKDVQGLRTIGTHRREADRLDLSPKGLNVESSISSSERCNKIGWRFFIRILNKSPSGRNGTLVSSNLH